MLFGIVVGLVTGVSLCYVVGLVLCGDVVGLVLCGDVLGLVFL